MVHSVNLALALALYLTEKLSDVLSLLVHFLIRFKVLAQRLIKIFYLLVVKSQLFMVFLQLV